jgi:hypothetical protein
MPRIIVTADRIPQQDDALVLLEESVQSIHLSSDHAARQLIERLTWALGDAEALERGGARASSAKPRRADRPSRPRGGSGYRVSSALT